MIYRRVCAGRRRRIEMIVLQERAAMTVAMRGKRQRNRRDAESAETDAEKKQRIRALTADFVDYADCKNAFLNLRNLRNLRFDLLSSRRLSWRSRRLGGCS